MNDIIHLDNERGQPAYIRLRQPDIDERKATTMRAQQPDGLSDDEWAAYGAPPADDGMGGTRLIAIYLTVCVIGLAGLLAYLTIT